MNIRILQPVNAVLLSSRPDTVMKRIFPTTCLLSIQSTKSWCYIMLQLRKYCYQHTEPSNNKIQKSKGDESVEEKFLQKDVQDLLFKLSRATPDIVYKPRRKEQLSAAKYKMLSKEDLEQMKSSYDNDILRRKLRCPPVMLERAPTDIVLEKDAALENYNNKKHIFIDTSYGLESREREVVVREVDGTLRHANWDERDRMNNIFYPKYYREIRFPKMFQVERLQVILEERLLKCEYILERAFVQFEPDSCDYIRVTERVYEHVNERSLFNELESTRWFGCLVFYLVRHANVDNLLLYLLSKPCIDSCVRLSRLHCIIHPDSEYAKKYATAPQDVNQVQQLKIFADLCCGGEADHIKHLLSGMHSVLMEDRQQLSKLPLSSQ